MDFVHTGRTCLHPEVTTIRTFYVGIQSPRFLEAALTQRIVVIKTLYEGILDLLSAMEVAHLDEWYLPHA